MMEPWVIWIVVATLFAIGEIFTLSFFLAPFAGGALVAALVAAVGLGVPLSIAAFLVASTGLLLGLRPIAAAHMRPALGTRTGTAALIGREATVLERIAGDTGSVKLEGEVWTARAYDGEEIMEPGARVTVVEIRGATALVSE
jgi:membrane protein implicated in regulation of membrane protease activity